MEEYMITTSDNPFNPFTQWDDWYLYDLQKGYCTCERLARIANLPYQVPMEVFSSEIEYAMEQLEFEGAIAKDGTFVNYLKVKNPRTLQDEK